MTMQIMSWDLELFISCFGVLPSSGGEGGKLCKTDFLCSGYKYPFDVAMHLWRFLDINLVVIPGHWNLFYQMARRRVECVGLRQ